MNTNSFQDAQGSDFPIDDVVGRAVNAFEALDRQNMPQRPSDDVTMSWLDEFTKLDVKRNDLPDTQFNRRKRIMRFMTPVAALAAGVALIVSLTMHGNNAFAQVVKQIKETSTVKFEMSISMPEKPLMSGSAVALRPHLMRIDWDVQGSKSVNVTNYLTGELISYDDASNVTIYEIPSAGGYDVIKQLLEIDTKLTRRLPDDENKVADTNLYELNMDGLDGRLWVSTETSLPVRIVLVNPKDLGGGETTYSDFQWDAAVDKSLFDIPAGRKVVRNTLQAEATEEELLSALRIRNAFSDAPYPADFIDDGVGLVIGRLAYDLDKSRAENYAIQAEKLATVQIGLNAVDALDGELMQDRIDYLCMKVDQWEYTITKRGAWVGEGVKPGENKPLCWWKLPGKNIRIVYGDLTIRDADEPPTK